MKHWYYIFFVIIILLAGCHSEPVDCPPVTPVLRSRLNGLIDEDAPIQFPLDDYFVRTQFETLSYSGVFENKRHAAEDLEASPGTAVYAIADGNISFSGKKGGYGLLIIIDHPQSNTYSLYGHLSPSRRHREPGPVAKGDLIAYIGDSDENGSSAKYGEMIPHLHFGIRQGQRTDYPSSGDWRWMVGWSYACPTEIGWLQPSQFILNYEEMSRQAMQAPAGAGWRRFGYLAFLGVWFTAVGTNAYRLYRKKKRADTELGGK
ncbi:MAG: M23 family metallopeptidase [Anaerolineales bacterium]|nr:M23 family metallopeptidase [Anaerolineales bacterium]